MADNKIPNKLLKTVDIKTALLAASNRKRKASSSPSVPTNVSKSIKLTESISEDDVEIVKDDCILNDCKENKDINTATIPINGKELPDKKMEVSESANSSENDLDQSSDEHDSLNNSLNTSLNALNTSGLSENLNTSIGDGNSTSASLQTPKSSSKSCNKAENSKKKPVKRKMTAEEAKKRTEEREKKLQERLQKKQEIEARKLEKRLEREKRLKLKEQEKKEREDEKKERERVRLEKKEQEEKEKLQKQKEKEEKVKIKQIMTEQKQEEKKKKEELKLQREEETKKADEEKRKAKSEKEQKEKEKQERAKAAFAKFFKKEGSSPITPSQAVEREGVFKPFQVSDDMTLAPVIPAAAQARFNKKQLDQLIKSQNIIELYLQTLKSGHYKDARLRKRQRKQRLCEADVVLVNEQEQAGLSLTAKLLQFSENVRPPYWGTWRKKSRKIRPRKPFGEDEIFDYSVDSDDEWDEGGPGESLSNTEEEAESEDDYEVDNEFFVPHGYLSAEEEKEDEEEVDNDPEKQKAVLKLKLQEFEKERKRKTTELRPIILGCFFESQCNSRDLSLQSLLQSYAAEFLTDSPIPTISSVQKSLAESKPQSNANSPTSATSSAKKKFLQFPEEAMPHLIRLIHGNINKRMTLIREFQQYWQKQTLTKRPSSPAKDTSTKDPSPVHLTVDANPPEQSTLLDTPNSDPVISKRQLDMMIKKISTYGKCPDPALKKCCWWVNADVLEKFKMRDLVVPNDWNYVSLVSGCETPPSVKSSASSIKEFLKP